MIFFERENRVAQTVTEVPRYCLAKRDKCSGKNTTIACETILKVLYVFLSFNSPSKHIIIINFSTAITRGIVVFVCCCCCCCCCFEVSKTFFVLFVSILWQCHYHVMLSHCLWPSWCSLSSPKCPWEFLYRDNLGPSIQIRFFFCT